jgi:hypothetical protein
MKLTFFFIFGFVVSVLAQEDLSSKTTALLSSFSGDLKKKTKYEFNDSERFNWHFVPRSRKGTPLYDLDEKQKAMVLSILQSSLSETGYSKALGVIMLEGVLREFEGNHRDPKKYFFTVFGEPSKEKPWAFRFEGHHLSLNFVCADGSIQSATPSFMGANPGIVSRGPQKGKEVLKEESDLGFKLINSLSPEKLKIARFSETALPEIISGNDRNAKPLEPKGIAYRELSSDQQKILLQLLDVYVKNYQLGFSKTLMDKITKAGIHNLSFAWSGSLKPGVGHYYRIQGPMLLIEYDNTQNNANHVHTVVRDLTNDFAEDILLEHYRKDHN